MNLSNTSVVSKIKDGLIVALAVAVLFVVGVSGNFTKSVASDTTSGFQTHQLEGSEGHAQLLPVGGNSGGPDGG